MAARRHMHEYGTTLEQLAEIAVSARYNAGFNPDAQAREPITIDDVLGSRMIADPFSALQCCLRSDGGAAAVLVAEDRVADLPGGTGVGPGRRRARVARVDGPVGRLHHGARPRCRDGWRSSGPASRPPTSTSASSTTPSPTCCSSRLEDLGFCAKGEGGAFVEDGQAAVGRGAAHQHRRRRPELVPSRVSGDSFSSSRRCASSAARPAGARCPTRRAGLRQRHRRLVLQQRHHDPRDRLTATVELTRPSAGRSTPSPTRWTPRPSSSPTSRPTSRGIGV